MHVKNIKNIKFIFKIYKFYMHVKIYFQFKFQHFQRHNTINDAYQLPQVGNFQSFAQLIGRHSLWAVCMSAIDN